MNRKAIFKHIMKDIICELVHQNFYCWNENFGQEFIHEHRELDRHFPPLYFRHNLNANEKNKHPIKSSNIVILEGTS